ncbi:MAG: hypothetical protein IMZ43_06495 [Thermoplasmata archaeon]|nr:hypothetical protein [Thermoplasmata archaeon]
MIYQICIRQLGNQPASNTKTITFPDGHVDMMVRHLRRHNCRGTIFSFGKRIAEF